MANAFWRTVLRFDRSKIAPEIAIRNTIGIVLPLIVGAATGYVSAGVVAALGAMNVSYSDSRDPYGARARRMSFASLFVGIAVIAGGLSGKNTPVAVLTATLWAFAVGMLVVLGQKAADLGAVVLMTLLVFAARSLSVTEALGSGLLAAGAGMVQMLLSIALWPVEPHGPERRIVAGVYQAIAGVAVSPAGWSGAPPATASMTVAQESLASLADDRSSASERLVFLLNQAERIRLTLLTLRRLARRIERTPLGRAPAAALRHVLAEASSALRTISESVPEAGPSALSTSGLKGFHDAAREFRKHNWAAPTAMFSAVLADARRQTDALGGQLRAAAGLAGQDPVAGIWFPRQDPATRIARLRANLSLRSTAFRHALRLAVSVGIGDAIARSLDIERSYWLPMTVAIVLKPDFTSTFSRGILRIGGTLAGLLAATALFHFLPTGPAMDIVLLALFALLLRGVGPANYGILVSAVSGIVVLLIAMAGTDPKDAMVARAVNTTAGGTLALIVYWIWPTWEKTQAGPVLADMLENYRAYFYEVVKLYAGQPDAKVDATRFPGRLARSNAEALAGRFGAEPGASPAQATLLNEMLVSSHAFVRAVMSIESACNQRHPAPTLNAEASDDFVNEFAPKVISTLDALTGALGGGTRLPDDLPDLRAAWTAMQGPQAYSLISDEADRIVVSLNTLREQIVKWNNNKR